LIELIGKKPDLYELSFAGTGLPESNVDFRGLKLKDVASVLNKSLDRLPAIDGDAPAKHGAFFRQSKLAEGPSEFYNAYLNGVKMSFKDVFPKTLKEIVQINRFTTQNPEDMKTLGIYSADIISRIAKAFHGKPLFDAVSGFKNTRNKLKKIERENAKGHIDVEPGNVPLTLYSILLNHALKKTVVKHWEQANGRTLPQDVERELFDKDFWLTCIPVFVRKINEQTREFDEKMLEPDDDQHR